MKIKVAFALITPILLTACTIPYGGEVQSERVGTLQCQGVSPIEQPLRNGTNEFPLRCGPQSQPVSR